MVRGGGIAVDCFQKLEKIMLRENLITGLLLGVFQLVELSRRCCDDRNIILQTDWNLALDGAFHSLDWAKHLATQSVTQLPLLGWRTISTNYHLIFLRNASKQPRENLGYRWLGANSNSSNWSNKSTPGMKIDDVLTAVGVLEHLEMVQNLKKVLESYIMVENDIWPSISLRKANTSRTWT